ncbi:MAG: InlB B-repeat-containing protein [Bifidobacterium longum]
MRTWLKRMVAGIVSAGTLMGGGLLMASTANADEIRMPDIGKTITSLTASAATTYPRELVNGGFDYLPAGGWNVISPKLNTSRGKFTSVDPVNGQYIRNAYVTDGNVAWVKWDGFDASKFGWISDQKGGKPQGFVTDHANSVELQRDNDTDNTYAEIVGSEIGKSIYQKIDTQNSTDAVYTVRFDHAALSSEHADGMQALVNGKPVTMTRIGGNKAGDKTGWTGTDIVTHATNTDHYRHDGQWATYEGKVTIPANTPVSTFTFKSLNEAKPDMGNLIDNLTFKIAYRLSYDSNGGTKAKASQISSMTEGKASETDGKVKTVTDDAAGSIPSNENAGAVKQAKSKTNGSVRLAADDDVAEYAANGLPDHLVNGDFEYPSMKSLQHYFTGIDRNRSQWISNGQGDDLAKWSDIPGGLDTTRFGWSSTQTQGAMSEQRANAVELQKATGETTQMGELCASQKDTAIYQDIATTPGTLYRIELDHTSRYRIHLDQMQVMVGAPGHEQPVEMTRTSSNKYGDKIGEKSTTIATHSTNPFGNQSSKDDFSHYVGYYTIPAGQSVTRFTFRQVSGVNTTSGNLLDNIVFTKAYKLDYDKNSDEATGQTPNDTATVKPAKTSATGGVKNVADTNASLPDHLVNGDFEYLPDGGWKTVDAPSYMTNAYTSVDPNNGQYMRNAKHSDADLASWVDWPGFDQSKFAWKTDQKGGHDQGGLKDRAEAVELQQDSMDGNTYAEMVASEPGRTIYQNLATIPGTLYKIRLKHTSLCKDNVDQMQVVINGTPIEMTRVAANGKAGDKVGEKSKTIGTRVTNENRWHHSDQWETYEGYYVIPDGQTTTRFGFKAVNYLDLTKGNLLDDVTFARAYKLSYDKNASDATGKVPSNQRGKENAVEPAESKTTGNVKTVADNTSNLPDHLVNGTFDYRGNEIINENQRVYGDTTYLAIISAKTGVIGNPLHSKLNNWDSGKFGWKSNDATAGVDTVEVQRRNHTPYPTNAGNVWGEIAAAKRGKYIYQDIATTPGIMYKWSLKHASRNADQDDSMQVMIGEPGKTVAQQATRTTSNGSDKTGSVGTTITTHGTAQDGKWETYTGTYIATSTTTRFTFRSVRDSNGQGLDFTAEGNCVDDLSFDKAYKLSYDKNSSDATGSVPSNQYGKENTVQPAKSKTTGSVGLAADKTASGLTVHDLKKNDKGKVPSNSKADSTQPAAFKAPDAKVETIASRAAGDELAVNGGFDTPKWTIAKEGQGLPWVYVKPNKGTIRSYAQAMAGQTGVKAGGLTAATFAWQDLDAIGSNQNFELHREKDGNTAADVHAGRTVAQTVNTTPGASYTFSIRHSGRSKGNAGGVTLLTGPDKDHLTPVKLTRTTVSKTGQKYGDKTGDVGTVAYTHSDSMDATEGSHEPWDHSDDWESYEGTVIIPAGQSRTMIAYRGVAKDGTLTASANDSIIDDLSFRLAYKLSYDANGGAKKSTSQIKASTDGKVKTIAGKTDSLPTELVNGSFDYPAGLIAGASTKYPWDDWTVVDPINGRYARHIGIDKDPWAPIPGWDASKFAWKSTQTKGTDWQQIAQGVELQKDSKTGNQYAELVAGQAGTAIYQDIATIPGASYRWTLKHASLDRKHLDGMSVMIGEPGKESAQDARRTTVNGNGDQPGDVGKVISTKVSNDAELNHESNHSSRNHDGQWETYTGTYIATGTVTRFTFKSVSSSNNVNGNILDDLSFTKAYRLGYDANGGKGQVPSRTEVGKTETAASKTNGTVRPAADKSAGPESGTIADDRRVLTDTTARQDDGTSQRTITRSDGSVRVETIATTGAVSGCQVYYPAGTRITLATAKADSDCWDSSQIGKTNRTFYGWSANTDANDRDVPVADTMDRNTLNANARTEIVMPARAKTVYALWAINPTLSYNVNTPAGSNAPGTPASQTVPYNTAAADKSGWAAGDTGKIPGYRFDGWYTAPNGGNKYDFNTPLTNNVTVYAHWIGNGYTVRFTGNGATGGGTPDQAFQYNIGQNLRRNGFTRDGYTFTGWKRADNQQAYGDGQWVTNLTTQPNGIVTMVAQWSANEAHIRYNPNPPAGKTTGGQGTPNWDGHTGDTPAIGGNGWTIDGYTFAGWTTSPDGSGTKYAPGASWTANGTLTLYAQWTPGEAGLTYDGNGATGGKTDPQNGVTDQKVNVRQNGFTRDGYTFVRWDTQADCRGKAVNPGDKWTLQGSSTLYACWAGVAQTLTYHGNGATGGNTAAQSGHTGDELTTNANGFTRDGYTFVRWDTAKDGSGIAYGEGKNGVGRYTMKPAGNDLYAIWQANPASIRYRDDYGATGSTPDTTGVTGQNVTIAQNGFTRPGYTFTGWARDRRTDPSLQPGGRYTLTPGTTTLWAQWKADPAHLIYNSNSGSTSQTRRTDGVVDQTLTVIANPFTRSGYTFTGWNTQADGRGKAYAAGNGFRLVADAKSNPVNTSVLYAQWRINRVTLKFDPNGGTGGYPDITADAFTTVTIPADAKEPKVQRPGFRFTGWAMKPTPGAGDTILSPGKGTVSMPDRGSITVYAQWAPAMTTLPFTGGHAQVPTIWLYAGFALMLIALGVMMPMLRMRMAATKRTGKHMPITGGKHAK